MLPTTPPPAPARSSPAPELLAAALAEGLLQELHLTPKPGLVDREDAGSHPDLSLALMERSVDLVAAHLGALAASLARCEPLREQVALARRAEVALLARLGTNTHRGALFLGGVLVAARHRAGSDDETAVRAAVSEVAREVAALTSRDGSQGEAARRRFGVGGVLGEVEAGLPSVFEVALPAHRAAIARGAAEEDAAFATMAALMQTVEDTTALHRCGAAGLARLREDGAALARVLAAGADPRPFLRERNEVYKRIRLTMGGVADLLGLTLGWFAYQGG